MNVGVLSESAADEAAIRVLAEAVLGESIKLVPGSVRTRGWPGVLHVLPSLIKELHYHTDAEALIVVVDSDDTPAHEWAHEDASSAESDCRLCKIQEAVRNVQSTLAPVATKVPLRVALGLAVPTIEAWYLCGQDPTVGEAMSASNQSVKGFHLRNQLKMRVYGTDRPPLALEQRRAEEHASRLASNIPLLEECFPVGFGSLARDLRRWV